MGWKWFTSTSRASGQKPLLAWENSGARLTAATRVVAWELPFAPTALTVTHSASAEVANKNAYVLAMDQKHRFDLEMDGYSPQSLGITFVLDQTDDEDGSIDRELKLLSTISQPQASGVLNGDASRNTDGALGTLFRAQKSKWQTANKLDAAADELEAKATAAAAIAAGSVASLPAVASALATPGAGWVDPSGEVDDVTPWAYWSEVLKSDRSAEDSQRPFRTPLVQFFWGEFSFVGYASTLNINILAVDGKGKIRRAEVALSLVGGSHLDHATPPRGEPGDAAGKTDAAEAAEKAKGAADGRREAAAAAARAAAAGRRANFVAARDAIQLARRPRREPADQAAQQGAAAAPAQQQADVGPRQNPLNAQPAVRRQAAPDGGDDS